VNNFVTPIHRRRLVRATAGLATIALFAACGTDNEPVSQAAAEPAATTDAADPQATEPVETTEALTEDSGRPANWPTKLSFGAVPAENASSLEADFATTKAILEAELGLDEIDFFQATDYAGVIEGMIANRIDIAQFGGFSYVIATSNGADISVAGVMADGPDIEPG